MLSPDHELWGAIDKTSPIPYHYQLRQLLERAVTSGSLALGERIPTEAWLCQHYEVSRTVVRQALDELERDGLVTRIRGKGTFISAPKVVERISHRITSLHEDLASRGRQLEIRVLRQEAVQAPPHVAGILEIGDEGHVIILERIGLLDGESLLHAQTYLPLPLCAAVLEYDMNNRSYLQVLEELGFVLQRSHRSIEARLAPKDVAQVLGIPDGSPMLVFSGTTYLEDGRPIDFSVDSHRGDRSQLEVESERGGAVISVQPEVEPLEA